MSFVLSGLSLTEWTRLTDNTETTIYTARKKTTIASIGWSETAGGTHTLLIVRDDGTNDHIIRGAKALTAYEIGSMDTAFTMEPNDTLKATSSDASGKAHIRVTYISPDAMAGGDHH